MSNDYQEEQQYRREATLAALAFRTIGRSLERVVNYRKRISEEEMKKVLKLTLSMAIQTKFVHIRSFTFWFLANIDVRSQQLLSWILHSGFVNLLIRGLKYSSEDMRADAVNATYNLIAAAKDQNVQTLLMLGIVGPLFDAKNSSNPWIRNKSLDALKKLFRKGKSAAYESRMKMLEGKK